MSSLKKQHQLQSLQSSYKHSKIKNIEDYKNTWEKANKDPEGFWKKKAKELLYWEQAFNKAILYKNDSPVWFPEGRLNACFNCLDHHLPFYKKKNAIIWEGENGDQRALTYKELYEKVNSFSAMLLDLGVRENDVVSLYMPMVPETVIAILACARVGAIHNAIFVGFSGESIVQRIEDTNSKIIVTLDGCYRGGKVLKLKETIDSVVKSTTCVQNIIVCQRLNISTFWDKNRDICWNQKIFENKNLKIDPVSRDANDPLFILYTSGSTGKPKGVVHSTAGYLLGAKLSSQIVFDLGDEDIFWSTADVGWITGHTYGVYGPLLNHGTIFMYEGALHFPDWGRVWSLIERYKITKFYTAPTAIRSFMREGNSWIKKYDLSTLKILGSVGEPLNKKAWWWYFEHVGNKKCPVVDTWWQTETGSIMLSTIPGVTPLKPGSVGLPLWGVQAHLKSIDKDCPEEKSLILNRLHPSFLKTLYNDHPRFLKQYFLTDTNDFKTGDKCIKDSDDFYWILGRMDDVMNVSGHRLSSCDLESAIFSHPLVAETAVVGKKDSIKGERPVAFVVLQKCVEDKEAIVIILKEQVRACIGAFAVPGEIRIIKSLPKTRSGKIMRRLLRQLANGDQITGDLSTLEDKTALLFS